MYFEEKFSFHDILQISQNLPNLDIQEFISLTSWFNKFAHLRIVETPPQKICLRLVKGWHRWIHSNKPNMIPFGSFTLFFFLSQATQRFTQLDSKLFSRFQNCLGNCQREYANVGVTVRANVTPCARRASSFPPGGSVALGCVVWSSNATCPRPHELIN